MTDAINELSSYPEPLDLLQHPISQFRTRYITAKLQPNRTEREVERAKHTQIWYMRAMYSTEFGERET